MVVNCMFSEWSAEESITALVTWVERRARDARQANPSATGMERPWLSRFPPPRALLYDLYALPTTNVDRY